jgi:hypothetical protein
VGYHGEELDFGFVYFFFLVGVQFVYFSRMFLLCPFDDEVDDESESYANQYKIEQFGIMQLVFWSYERNASVVITASVNLVLDREAHIVFEC